MWKKLREKQRNRQECTTAAAVVRILGGKFLEVHMYDWLPFCKYFLQIFSGKRKIGIDEHMF